MGQTRGQLKTTIRTNLADLGVTFYSDDDLNDSLQDAYDDIAVLTQCLIGTRTLNWVGGLVYYDFKTLGVTDYLGCIAIFNNLTNWWLRDDLNLRDLPRIRRDWELWIGTPQFWVSSDPVNTIIAPHLPVSTGTYKLVYSRTAPVLSSDGDQLETASDVQNLFEFYTSADMLEQAQEFDKANEYWEKYYNSIDEYAQRVKTLNRHDLLLRV